MKYVMTSLRNQAGDGPAMHCNSKITATSNEWRRNNVNIYFALALHNILSSKKELLIFSEVHRRCLEFEEKYVADYRREFEN
jgi:hypothetical protein